MTGLKGLEVKLGECYERALYGSTNIRQESWTMLQIASHGQFQGGCRKINLNVGSDWLEHSLQVTITYVRACEVCIVKH